MEITCPVSEVAASMRHVQVDGASTASICQDALQQAHPPSVGSQNLSIRKCNTSTGMCFWHTLSVFTICRALVLAIPAAAEASV